jgi:hypothetical protein
MPREFTLGQNYPNPFNPSTKINYQLPVQSYVTLKLFDLLGREVATLVDGIEAPGNHSANWDASGMASGVYFYTLYASPLEGKDPIATEQNAQGNIFVETKKLLLLR